MLYSRDNRELDLLLFWEVCDFVSRVDRVLSRPGGSLLLAGRSGVGRHTATCLVSHMHGYTLFTPKVSRGYSLKHFSNDLKLVRLGPLFFFFTLCKVTSLCRMRCNITAFLFLNLQIEGWMELVQSISSINSQIVFLRTWCQNAYKAVMSGLWKYNVYV